MSGVSAVQRGEVHSAIARASAATGVDFNYLLAQAKLESGLDSSARAGTSSAAGLYQFIGGTWLETLDRHGSTHGLAWADSLISRSGGRATIHDPAARAQVMALRFDPNVSALMAAELARDNSTELSSFLGREPDSAELYLAHFLGAGGAKRLIQLERTNPNASAAAAFPDAARANRSIFHGANGKARNVSEVLASLTGQHDTRPAKLKPAERNTSFAALRPALSAEPVTRGACGELLPADPLTRGS